MSPETDSGPPPSPPPFWAGNIFDQGGNWRGAKSKQEETDKKFNYKKKRRPISEWRRREGINLAELDERDPELASAVRLMVEQEEKDEGELEKRSKTGLKQVVCIYKN